MSAAYDSAKVERLLVEVRKQYAATGAVWTAESLDMADQLEAARAEILRLETRQQELLATIVKLTNELLLPDEVKDWTEQRRKLVAEIGSLRSQLAEHQRRGGAWPATLPRRIRELVDEFRISDLDVLLKEHGL